MNYEETQQFRKRVELGGELRRIEEKIWHVNKVLSMSYYAEVKVTSRTLIETEDPMFPNRIDGVAVLPQSLFSKASFGLWNDLNKSYCEGMISLLEIRKMELIEEIESL